MICSLFPCFAGTPRCAGSQVVGPASFPGGAAVPGGEAEHRWLRVSGHHATAPDERWATLLFDGPAPKNDLAWKPLTKGFVTEISICKTGDTPRDYRHRFRSNWQMPEGFFFKRRRVTSRRTGSKKREALRHHPQDLPERARTHQGSDQCPVNTTNSVKVTADQAPEGVYHRMTCRKPLPMRVCYRARPDLNTSRGHLPALQGSPHLPLRGRYRPLMAAP